MECVERRDGGSVGSSTRRKSTWKILWHYSVPPKVQQFMYRIGTVILPTKVNLGRRMEMEIVLCPMCKEVAEKQMFSCLQKVVLQWKFGKRLESECLDCCGRHRLS